MKPVVAASLEAVRQAVADARRRGLSVGLVPTMGALHEGHASLIRAARAETGFVVVSIFVNPTQFGPNEDFHRYPRPLDQDLQLCSREGADLAFVPEVATMFPPDFRTFVEVTGLQDPLEGACRPGHFRGVATVVLKLFNIVQPDRVYFGQKDGQQARLVRQMAIDLDVPVEVRVCPTVRDPDGLALSSRNQYLNADQRRQARVLYQALEQAHRLIEQGERDAEAVRRGMVERIAATPGAVLDYAEVVDVNTLRSVERLNGEVMLVLAVRFGATRLIDNLLVAVSDQRSAISGQQSAVSGQLRADCRPLIADC
jgi:pantoate--beta-alanine ligase